MQIGIIGAGAIGTAIARALSNAGIEVAIANSRGSDSLRALARELGPRVRPVEREEAARAEMVFVAVNWSKLPAALDGLGPWDGRIVVDANNPLEAPSFQPFDLGGRGSSEVVAQMLPGARLVKAFNHLPPALLARPSRYPHVFRFDGEGRVLESLQASSDSDLPSFSSVVQHGDELLLGTPGGVGEIDADRAYRVRLR